MNQAVSDGTGRSQEPAEQSLRAFERDLPRGIGMRTAAQLLPAVDGGCDALRRSGGKSFECTISSA